MQPLSFITEPDIHASASTCYRHARQKVQKHTRYVQACYAVRVQAARQKASKARQK